ncbi:MAG: YihY/virulence factor BrkB family protein [Chloroflexi bacterium]|nr:MAG: YihY/virulence factor BrkB family protein [Chloroflexota bacterium]
MEMATETARQPGSQKHQRISRILKTLDKKTKPFQEFWAKFNNDWSWNNAAGLAFNLILSIFPLVIALLALIGFFVGRLDPVAYQDFKTSKLHDLFPAVTSSQNIIQPALRQLTKDSGILGIFAIVVSIFNGSRLFMFLQGCFDLIYHVRPRNVIVQNALSVVMVLLFVILVPIMVLASSLPAIVSSLLQKTPEGLLLSVSGIVSGLIGAYVLFQVIYMVVPNQKISFRKSWRGAVVAAFLLELYLVLFPLYVTTFLGSFAGAVGVLILLIFFYYFALILFLGAEVNAFFAEGVRSTPYDVPTMIHLLSSHLPTSEQDVKEQAAADHKDEVPKEIRPKRGQSSGQSTDESTRAEKRAS